MVKKAQLGSAPAGGEGRSGRVQVIWDDLRTSFWFVPGLMGLAACVLSWCAHQGDMWLSQWPAEALPPVVYVNTGDTAHGVISTLLGSMMTMTSLVFSITMVVLTLAASQFGPRLIRNFMGSPHTQYVLGTFVMTTIYCLLMYGVIGTRTGDERGAFLSVSLAMALVLLSIALLVIFLHFLARSIVSESVIERVGSEIRHLWDELEPIADEHNLDPGASLPEDYQTAALRFGSAEAGYVEAIEFDELVALASASGVLIGLNFAPGDYVIKGGQGIGVYPAERCDARLQEQIRETISIGPHRTPVQDPEFSIRHLVEIAVRALSPAVNDPYTAVSVINQLSSSMSQLMGRSLPESRLHDAEGNLRVVCPRPTYASMLGSAFNQIRQNARSSALVYIYLVEALHRIAEMAKLGVQKEALRAQLEAVLQAARREVPDAIDREAIELRANAVVALLND